MNAQDIKLSIRHAKDTLSAADEAAYEFAKLLRYNLRAVTRSGGWYGADVLKDLKKELRDFNAVTGEWKS